jgi:hypothetical protein
MAVLKTSAARHRGRRGDFGVVCRVIDVVSDRPVKRERFCCDAEFNGSGFGRIVSLAEFLRLSAP